jgi:hypothetical protein
MKLQKKYGMATCSGRHLWLLVGGGVSPISIVVDKRVLALGWIRREDS